ncbi:cadherin repeat domain-containing protein, partial [Porticoccaceae bacterium]|nr:cadherin repeat domain-containing protein [Porticoccaceae bacterium]
SDDSDLDGDASTDQIVSFGWASLFGNWPGSESADLAEITFDIAEGAEGTFDLNFTASSTAAGYTFVGQNQEIAIQTVVQPPLTIDSATGDVTLNVNPDFESVDSYDFIVVANAGTDSEEQVPTVLAIGNLDEVAPTINSSSSVAAIDENSGAGQVIYTVTADDSADASDGVTFALAVGSDSALSIDANTGAVTLADNPDYELKDQYNFSVVATDIAGLSSASLPLTLNINNVDDTAPVITSSADAGSVSENSGAGQVIYTAEATDETSDVVFSLAGDDAAAFSIDSASGAVQLIANPDFEAKNSYSFDVVASDEAGNSSQQNVTLSVVNVDDAAPVITSGAAADGIVENSGAGQVIYTATANDGLDISDGVTYSLADGSDNALSIDIVSGEVTVSVLLNHGSED